MKNNKLSFTKLSMFNECGLKYRYHYIDYLRPNSIRSALIFGKAIDLALNELLLHRNINEAIAIFYREFSRTEVNGEGIYVPTSNLVKYSKADLDKDLIKESYQDSEQWESLYQKGLLIIEAYAKKVLPRIKKVISIQKEVSLQNSDGDEITAKLDFVAEWDDGKTYLLDNKTTSVEYKQEDVKKSLQLGLYHYIEKENTKLDGVGFIVINKNIRKIRHCKKCNFLQDGTHKKCNNMFGTQRCNGDWNVTFDVDIDFVFDRITEQEEEIVLESFDKANHGIMNKQFDANKSSCFSKFGKCVYYDKCHKGSDEGLVKLYQDKKDDK